VLTYLLLPSIAGTELILYFYSLEIKTELEKAMEKWEEDRKKDRECWEKERREERRKREKAREEGVDGGNGEVGGGE